MNQFYVLYSYLEQLQNVNLNSTKEDWPNLIDLLIIYLLLDFLYYTQSTNGHLISSVKYAFAETGKSFIRNVTLQIILHYHTCAIMIV